MPITAYTGATLGKTAPALFLPVTATMQAFAVAGASNPVLTSGRATIGNADPVAKVSLGLGTAAVVGSGPQLPPGGSYTVDTSAVGTVYAIANTFQVTMYDCGGSSFLSPNPFPPFTTPCAMVDGEPTDDSNAGAWSAADYANFTGKSRIWKSTSTANVLDSNALDIESSGGIGAVWGSTGKAYTTTWVSNAWASGGFPPVVYAPLTGSTPIASDVSAAMTAASVTQPFYWIQSTSASYSNPANWPAGWISGSTFGASVIAVQYVDGQGAHSNYDISTVIAADLLLLMH